MGNISTTSLVQPDVQHLVLIQQLRNSVLSPVMRDACATTDMSLVVTVVSALTTVAVMIVLTSTIPAILAGLMVTVRPTSVATLEISQKLQLFVLTTPLAG